MVLHVDNLTVRRGERTILAGLSVQAISGEALLLTGRNGAGKTTLLRTIAGLLTPATGSIRLDLAATGAVAAASAGTDADADASVAERAHFIGHLNGIKPSLTVRENAAFWTAYLGAPAAGIAPALERFRLADLATVPAGYLSAGQKRRLGLCRLVLAPRPLWLLDEPAVSLDTSSQAILAEAVNAHLAVGGLVVAATHQPLGFAPARELRLGASGLPAERPGNRPAAGAPAP